MKTFLIVLASVIGTIVGLGLLISFGAPALTRSLERSSLDSKTRTSVGDIKSLSTAVDLWSLDHSDRYPATLHELTSGPKLYVNNGIRLDPWSRSYIYCRPARDGKEPFEIFSMGPDGRQGTKDDVTINTLVDYSNAPSLGEIESLE